MDFNLVKWIQVENTTKCNAWCPHCGRNKRGFGLQDDLVVEDLPTQRLEHVLSRLPALETVQFCGSYGDTMAAANVLEQISTAKKFCRKIQIHTHGGLRNKEFWKDTAALLSDIEHDVWFGIDGLKGVHEYHRQGTDFNKAIENAGSFITNGGHATWQFIPWAHNEHQIKDCLILSKKLGFKDFKLLKDVRTRERARHWRTGEIIEFFPWSQDTKKNRYKTNPIPARKVIDKSMCRHLTDPSIYLNANGTISACCYFNVHRSDLDSLPDIDSELLDRPHQICLTSCGKSVKVDSNV